MTETCVFSVKMSENAFLRRTNAKMSNDRIKVMSKVMFSLRRGQKSNLVGFITSYWSFLSKRKQDKKSFFVLWLNMVPMRKGGIFLGEIRNPVWNKITQLQNHLKPVKSQETQKITALLRVRKEPDLCFARRVEQKYE